MNFGWKKFVIVSWGLWKVRGKLSFRTRVKSRVGLVTDALSFWEHYYAIVHGVGMRSMVGLRPKIERCTGPREWLYKINIDSSFGQGKQDATTFVCNWEGGVLTAAGSAGGGRNGKVYNNDSGIDAS